ncbi:MAG TPA: hypothetical protein VKW04_04760 [Planctomycetota bacterium]|nr:hypothetical protein [Planctomycetota bacterium]
MRVLLLLPLLFQSDPSLDAIRKALRETGEEAYSYRVKGRFEREGESLPGPILTSRMKVYQSARHGDRILVKGPDGLWRTPEDRLGEKTEKTDPDAADIVRTLQGAEAPHRIVEALLGDVDKGRDSDDREVDGVLCLRYVLSYRMPALKESLEKLIEKAVEKKTLTRPDEIRWSSSAKGSLRLYFNKRDGRLVKAVDERSVKIAYRIPDQQPDLKTYKTEMDFELSDWGKATPQLPPEVRVRLEIKDP